MIHRDVQAGDLVRYMDERPFRVDHVRHGIAYECESELHSTKCFIYKFADGTFNKMHSILEG